MKCSVCGVEKGCACSLKNGVCGGCLAKRTTPQGVNQAARPPKPNRPKYVPPSPGTKPTVNKAYWTK